MNYRSGIIASFILCLVYSVSFAQSEDAASPDWSKYHSTADAYTLLKAWHANYPDLTELYSIGKTLKGTELMVLEITNKETGNGDTKPGYYYDGNIHAGELTGAEVALHFAWYVLSRYGEDDRITKLLDTRTLYVRPKFNPDGADIALTTDAILRSTPRPYDEDLDGLLDEDPENDLDNNDIITQMRVKNPNGLYKISPEDSRLMVRRSDLDISGEFYDVLSEGVDDDKDGLWNEDGLGGIDMNRNFPRNWGMEFEQNGAGPYPLSEPETRATIEFLHSHRNITGVFHGHTSGGILFRLPSTTSWDNYNMADQRLIMEMSRAYETTTGQRAIPSYSNPRLHRHGTLISWSYWDFGVVGFVPEFWGHFQADLNGDGNVTDLEELQWNDKMLGGKAFINWKKYKHPDLGEVEIGGWNRKFTFQNPPNQYLREEIEKYIPWMLYLAEISPIIQVTHELQNKEGRIFTLKVAVENTGYLPTNITQRALDAEIAVPVRAQVSITSGEIISGKDLMTLGHLKGSRDMRSGSSENSGVVEWVIRADPGSKVHVTITSEKAGVRMIEIPIK